MKRDIFTAAPDDVREVRHFHLFGAIGGGAKGFMRGKARVGNMVTKSRCLGSVDVDLRANRDFLKLVGVPATLLDLFDREQYIDFHGKQPPSGWKEATAEDIRRAAGYEYPHIVFLSAPCKGFSGLLAEGKSKTAKYQALNRLTLRGVWLMLEAFAAEPPELIVFENVPRIATRGRQLLDKIVGLLRSYGYAVAETTHDCGEIGQLAQSRKRFLLVARHIAKVPPFLYEPEKKKLQAVGTVLDRMPMPGDTAAGPMHRVPNLHWKTWVRLAFVEAGSDWRSLNKLAVEDGVLRDYLIVPEFHRGYLGVNRWDESMGTVAGRSTPSNGSFSIADPRFPADGDYGQLGVRSWNESTGTVTGQRSPIQGGFSVADPRTGKDAHANVYRIVGWGETSGAVSSAACHDNGRWSVADPRLPEPSDKLVAVIRALDGTWHRPFTTLELAALQSLIEPEEYLELDGLSDSDWRERIGNAVPPAAAEAIANVMFQTLLLAWSGETFILSSAPIWVQPVAIAMSLAQGEAA